MAARVKTRLIDQVVTADEAAAIIGVSPRRCHDFLSSGRLPARQSEGGTWLIARADAEAFVRGKSGRPRAAAQ